MVSPIRAIIARFSLGFSHGVVRKVLQERPFDFCGIIAAGAEPQFYDVIPASQQEWFDSGAVRVCHYRNVDWTALLPLDEELMSQMHACEILFMETVCRQEWKRPVSYRTRRHWYLRHLRFWNDYIERHRINLYISAWLPHEVPDVIIYHLCKYKGVPILYLHMSTERDTAFIEHDIERSAAQVGQRYEELLREYGGIDDTEQIPLSSRFEGRYRALIAQEGQKPPLEQISMYSSYGKSVWALLRSRPCLFVRHGLGYLTPRGAARMRQAWKRSRIIRQRDALYDAHAVEPDLRVPYIYFPLHLQPEASTVPMGSAFADQVVVAELLAAALPPGVLIYVKEHYKKSSWLGRTEQDYRDLLALPSVRFVRRSVDTFALREHCRAIATVSGSAGFEGLFRGKPCFLFGHRFYQYASGVYCIHTREDLQRAVHEVFARHAAPTSKTCRLYLKAMEEVCVHGTVNPWDKKVSHLTDEEHIRANSEAILHALGTREGLVCRISIGSM